MANRNMSEIERYEAALRAVDETPSAEALAAAPLLDNWFFARDMQTSTHLSGEPDNHPELGGGKPILTSILVAMDLEAGWARSFNRLYRLGTPLSHDDPRVADRCGFMGVRLDDIRLLSKRMNSNRESIAKRLRALSR